jgi:hypothetical protein
MFSSVHTPYQAIHVPVFEQACYLRERTGISRKDTADMTNNRTKIDLFVDKAFDTIASGGAYQ